MNPNRYNLDARPRARLLALALALALSACGGGGGSPGAVGSGGSGSGTGGTGTTTPAAPTVTVSFVNAGGAVSNGLSGATPLTARATVRDQAGKPIANALVSFATDNTLAVFSPSAGTALTDANGVASVTMRAANLAAGGAGKLSATSSVAGATVTGEANYSVGATALTFGTLNAAPASIQAYGSTVLSVDLLASGAKYTDQQVNVHFSSACVAAGKATLADTVATNNGTAQAVYRDQGCANNDVITAAADGVAKSVTAALAIAAPAPSSVQFVEASPTDKSIVIQGQGGINRTETATLKFKVIDTFGHPLSGKQVNFSVSNPTVVHLNKTNDSTDQNGEVITTVNSGTVATTFRVQATLPGTAANGNPDISTTSDSVVVTTGLPVQRAFSLSAVAFNLEGWNFDSTPDKPATQIRVMLADSFGNPVPDGTPVVFQTNMGSVGSSSKGACNTVNGGCFVDFRVQNPRVALPNSPATPCNTGNAGSTPDSTRPGLATVCASSTDGTNTVFGKVSLFFSGSSAANVFLDGVNVTGGTDLGTVKSADTKIFTLQLNDTNLNPLPLGTKVEVTNLINATAAAVVPATVPDIFPHSATADDISGSNVSGAQGSFHKFSISSTAGASCTQPTAASFNVMITTPFNGVTNIPFKLTFSCP